MTRRVFATVLIASPALAIEHRQSIWRTDAGRRAIALRQQLEREGRYDNLPENWTEVEAAIREGCQYFVAGVSRVEPTPEERKRSLIWGVTLIKRTWYRVLPVAEPPNEHGWAEPWRRR